MNTFHRAGLLVLAGAMVTTISGCGVIHAMQREHHFKKGESSALILDAKERVITQRDIQEKQPFADRVVPNVIMCSEPSPDVANALSTAIAASLTASLPGATGAKSVSADISRSTSESLMQLGSRIATIQLLRDELADLCRSYANGAVTQTTYTLRLSRLDKKMVTLLLSEAAGRPSGAQSVVLGDAAAGTKPAASPEDIAKARQAVVDASAEVVGKEKAFKEASEETWKEKQLERDAALRVLQEKQATLLSMERRLLETSTGSDVQTVLVNSSPGSPDAGQTLQMLQENFLLQDDLTTFLDACISSLDRQVYQLNDKQQLILDRARDQLQTIETNSLYAKNDYNQTRALIERSEGAEKETAMKKLQEIEQYLNAADLESSLARKKYDEATGQLQPVSRFAEYCQGGALRALLDANRERIDDRIMLTRERRQLAELEARNSTLRACEVVVASTSADATTRQACTTVLVQSAKSIGDADSSAAPRAVRTRNPVVSADSR